MKTKSSYRRNHQTNHQTSIQEIVLHNISCYNASKYLSQLGHMEIGRTENVKNYFPTYIK